MTTKQLSHVQVKDAAKGTVTAVFSTLNVVDSDGDVTLPGAFTDGAKVRISAYGHRSWTGDLPVGKGTISEKDDEAILDGQFFLDTTAGRDTFTTVKELGELQEWSYSLENVRSKMGEFEGREVRFLEKIDVTEVSPVLKGAGVGTRTLAVKGEHPERFSEHGDAVLTVVRQFIDRIPEVIAFRETQGKSGLSEHSVELLDLFEAELKRLIAARQPSPPPDDFSDDVAREYARFVALNQGVRL